MTSEVETRKRPRWRRWAYEGIIVFAVFVLMQAWFARGAITGPAPELQGVTPNGAPIGLADQPTVVHFWATWCGICGAMDDNIDALGHSYNVVSVALTSGDGAAVNQHLAERDLTFPVLMDENGLHAARWGVRGVPTTFLVSSSGQVEQVTVGYSTRLGLYARLWYLELRGRWDTMTS